MGEVKRCLRFHLPSDRAKTYYETRASDIEDVVLCVLRGVLTERPTCDLRQWVADWCRTDAFLQGAGAGAGAAPVAHSEAGSAEADEAIPTVDRASCFSRCEDWRVGLFARMWTGTYHPPAADATRLRVRRGGKGEQACEAEARRLGILTLPSAEAEAEAEAEEGGQARACVIEELHTACCDEGELAVLRTEVFPRVWRTAQHPCLQEFWGFAEGSGGSLFAVSAAPGYVSVAAWGQTLAARRERASLLQVHRLVLQAAAALQFLHAHGVVHGGVEAECLFLASPDAERFVLWDSGARAAFDARRRQRDDTPLLGLRERERTAEAQRWRECPATGGGGGGGGVSPGNDILRLGHVVAHVCRYCCEGPLSVARPPACPEDFWEACVLPCFGGETAAGAVRAAAEAFDSVRTADDAAVERAAFGELKLPLPGDGLSFLQYNVPHLRRTVALRLAAAAAAGGTACVDLTELCEAAAAHVAEPSLSTALLETARALVASRGSSVSALSLSRGTAAAAAAADASSAFPWRLPPVAAAEAAAEEEEKLYAAVAGAAAGCEALHTLALSGLVVPPAQLEDFLGALAGTPAMLSLAYCEAPVVPPGGGGGGVRLPPELLLRGLKELRLAGCGLCDAQVEEAFGGLLRAEDRLEVLDLSKNRLGPASGLRLAEGVARSRTVASLCLARNRLGDETARAFAAALRENDSVECFDMRHNGLTLGSVAELTRTLQGRPHISLYKTEGMFSFVRGEGEEECPAC